VQSRGLNYLIPVDANIETDADLEDAAINFNYVLNLMDDARNRLNIAILDACRNNPFAGRLRSVQQGLAQLTAPTGTLVAYSTSPERTAADGAGNNSPYTEELVSQMQLAGVFVETVFRRVAEKVSLRTVGRQEPWFSANVKGEFYFRSPSLIDGVGNSENRVNREKDWGLVSKNNCAEINLFLKAYPGDFEATLYEMRLSCSGKTVAGVKPTTSPNAEHYANTGLKHYEAKDFDRAIRDCTEAIKIDPKYALAYSIRGFAKYEQKKYDEAVNDLTEAIRLNPRDAAGAYKMRASCHQIQGNHARAIADATKSIELNPGDANTYVVRGSSHYFLEAYDQAVIDCSEALKLNDKYEYAYFVRAAAQFLKGKYDDAILDSTTIIGLNPTFDHAFYVRGFAYEKKGNFHKAILDYTESIKLRKSDPTPYRRRAECYEKLGDDKNAESDRQQASQLEKKETKP
jgi:tetratricopeptide (TPR) repeat protein